MTKIDCRWVDTEHARVLPGRHEIDCHGAGNTPPDQWMPLVAAIVIGTADCAGCEPCPDTHCAGCNRTHVDGGQHICTPCVADVREDLDALPPLFHQLPAEAIVGGINSEAANLIGPSPRYLDWLAAPSGETRTMSEKGPTSPAWVLGRWETIVRSELEHPDPSKRFRLSVAMDYLGEQLTACARSESFAENWWPTFRRELSDLRAHCERVLHDGEQHDWGVTCLRCQVGRLEKVYGPRRGEFQGQTVYGDSWRCSKCRATVTESEYRLAVAEIYRANADWLPADDIDVRFGVGKVKLSTWCWRGKVAKRHLPERPTEYRVVDVKVCLHLDLDDHDRELLDGDRKAA